MKKNTEDGIKSASEKTTHVIMLCIIVLLCFCCLYPFLLILSTSFQTQDSFMNEGYRVFKKEYTIETYKMIFANPSSLLDSYFITIVTSVLTTVIGVITVSLCGYVLSRKEYRYRKILSAYVLFTMLFNGGMVASYILIARWLNMKDTIWALILPLCCSAWNIILCKAFFSSIPNSYIESAKLDGASESKIFFSIIIPVSKPAVATVSMMLLLSTWNEYMNCMLYTDSEKLAKLQYYLMKIMANIDFLNSPEYLQYVGIQGIGAMSIPTYGARMAVCVLIAGPILLVFPFFQKYFVKGINAGGIKG